MCSIEGTTDHTIDIDEYATVNSFRGPDHTNSFINRYVQFAHNLLKIQPNKENLPQPFITSQGNVLVYNGEIYGLGDDVFDAEWLAERIESQGIESLAAGVNGMWALAWYNVKENSITLCRDHFGTKPLYYVYTTIKGEDKLYFSSTPLPLIRTVAEQSHVNWMSQHTWNFTGANALAQNNGFNIGEQTIYRGIKRIMPGQILKFELGTTFKLTSNNLWKLDKDFNLFPNYMWNPQQFEHITKKAITEVCHAPEIKKTISLSGGLDSSLIASLAKDEDNISVSSVGWEGVNIGEKDPERHLLREMDHSIETAKKLGLTHHRFKIKHSYKDDRAIQDEINRAMNYIPSWDMQRLIPRFLNITQAKSVDSKIYITGDCADETLTGYNGDFNKWCDKKIHNIDSSRSTWYVDYNSYNQYLSKARDYVKSPPKDSWSFENFLLNGQELKETPQWKEREIELDKYLNQELFSVDGVINGNFKNLLQHCDGFCTVIDSMCGYYGMESRVPFLHQEWVKYSMKIPGAEKLRIPWDYSSKPYHEKTDHQFFMLGHYKGLFRENFKGHYTDKVRYGYRKVGFSNPWNSRDARKNNNLILENIRKQFNNVKMFVELYSNQSQILHRKNRDALFNLFGVDFDNNKKYNKLNNVDDED